MIYLASPYSHPDEWERHRRFIAAREFCYYQTQMGVAIFSPIVYGHQFSRDFDAPYTFEPYIDFNCAMLELCSELWVLLYPHWDKSRGIAYELDFAAKRNIPVTYKEVPPHVSLRHVEAR
jgi:hypothetical protein